MILDKYSKAYSRGALKREWTLKVEHFKTAKADRKEFQHVFDALIDVTRFIAASAFAARLFPGTALDELRISPVKNNRIDGHTVMRMYCTQNGQGAFAGAILRDGKETYSWSCSDHNLIQAFLDNIHRLEAQP